MNNQKHKPNIDEVVPDRTYMQIAKVLGCVDGCYEVGWNTGSRVEVCGLFFVSFRTSPFSAVAIMRRARY